MFIIDVVVVVDSKGLDAVVDATAHSEGITIDTDADAAVHSVEDKIKTEEPSVTDVDATVHSAGDTIATDVDAEIHSEGAQDTVATDVDAAVHSDGDKVMSKKSPTIDVAVVYSEGPNAAVDSIAHHEGTAFATDVDAAVHSVGDQTKADETSATDVDAIVHSDGSITATDVDSDVYPERT